MIAAAGESVLVFVIQSVFVLSLYVLWTTEVWYFLKLRSAHVSCIMHYASCRKWALRVMSVRYSGWDAGRESFSLTSDVSGRYLVEDLYHFAVKLTLR